MPDNPDPEVIYGNVCNLFEELAKMMVSQPGTPGTKHSRDSMRNQELEETLEMHWKTPYVGPSCVELQKKIRKYEGEFSPDEYYSKSLLFIQSSGAGKSRLVDEFGLVCPLANYVLRDLDTGYPPSDRKVYDFMKSAPTLDLRLKMDSPHLKLERGVRDDRAEYIWFHAISVGILQATFQECKSTDSFSENYLLSHLSPGLTDTQLVTHILSKCIVDSNQENSLNLHKIAESLKSRTGYAANGDQKRNREDLDKNIAAAARNIAATCVEDCEFRALFNEFAQVRRNMARSHCKPITDLKNSAGALQNVLENLQSDDPRDPFFTVVFDEVGTIMAGAQNGRFIALNRIIRLISESHKIWYFFLSTESNLEAMLPPDQPSHPSLPGPNRASSRGDFHLRRFPPFTTFAVDIKDIEAEYKVDPAQDTMSLFSQEKHMSRFGRPLWSAYKNPDNLAKIKLIGGRMRAGYDGSDKHDVFAALSIRLCLEMNLANPLTIGISRAAVNLHLRIVKSADPVTGDLFTRTPSEPLVAYASMQHLAGHRNRRVWPNSLRTFTNNLLSPGVIDKGIKGELFARLLFTLAHDSCFHGDIGRRYYDTSIQKFTVKSFLHALFASGYHGDIDSVDKVILDAHMNFLMFTSTDRRLDASSLPKLCHALLRRSAALQLARQQEYYDLLVPFYCGKPGESYDLSKTGAILVQVKNHVTKTSPGMVLGKQFVGVNSEQPSKRPRSSPSGKSIPMNQPGVRLLFILLDFGVEESGVSVSSSRNVSPKVWAIHATGHGPDPFGCLEEMNVVDEARVFFNDLTTGQEEGDEIAFTHDADMLRNIQDCDQYV